MTHSVCEAAPVTKSTSLIATNPTTDIFKELASKQGILQLLMIVKQKECQRFQYIIALPNPNQSKKMVLL